MIAELISTRRVTGENNNFIRHGEIVDEPKINVLFPNKKPLHLKDKRILGQAISLRVTWNFILFLPFNCNVDRYFMLLGREFTILHVKYVLKSTSFLQN